MGRGQEKLIEGTYEDVSSTQRRVTSYSSPNHVQISIKHKVKKTQNTEVCGPILIFYLHMIHLHHNRLVIVTNRSEILFFEGNFEFSDILPQLPCFHVPCQKLI